MARLEGRIEPVTLLLLVPVLILTWTHGVACLGLAVQRAESGAPIQVEAKVIAAVVREACARALLRALGPLGWFQPGPRHANPSAVSERRTPPVLLVPGLGWSRVSLLFLRRFLVQRGFGWAWAINRSGSGDGTLAVEAEHLAKQIRELRATSGADQVDVVGFFTGGLTAAWLLRHHEESRASVRRLVAVATPWHGTRLAVFGRGAALRQIRFGSHLLDDLWPPPVPTFCVWSASDLVVVPASSAALQAEQGADVCIEAAGHVELLVSARAFRAIQASLEHPLAEGPRPAPALHANTSPTLVPDPAVLPVPRME